MFTPAIALLMIAVPGALSSRAQGAAATRGGPARNGSYFCPGTAILNPR